MNGAAVASAAIALPVALVLGLVLTITALGAPADACTPSTGGEIVDGGTVPSDANVEGFGRAQLENAVAIVNAATAMQLPAAAQVIGVQAAIGESSLVNLDTGDGAINPDGSIADSMGLFQQQSSWGTVAQRMDPTTAATLFYQRLITVPDWESLLPTVAINKVQINADPFHYSKYADAAVSVTAYIAELQKGGGAQAPTEGEGAGGCSVSGDARAVAQELAVAIDNGSLKLLEKRYAEQITNMAEGTASEDCIIDVRILQFISLSLQKFPKVGVSDLNRKCTGSTVGAGTGSAHYFKGGGYAVDFYSLNGAALNGKSPDNLALLDLLSSVAPDGTRAGQVDCRSGQTWPHVSQFEDSCNHQHIDFGYTDLPLRLSN